MNNKNKICWYIMILSIISILVVHLGATIYTNNKNKELINQNNKIVEEYKEQLEKKEHGSNSKNNKINIDVEKIQVELKQIQSNAKSQLVNNVMDIMKGLILSIFTILPVFVYKKVVKYAEFDLSFSEYTNKILTVAGIVSILSFTYDIYSRISDLQKFQYIATDIKKLFDIINEMGQIFL